VAESDRSDAMSHTTTVLVPKAATIDGFAEATAGTGVSLFDLDPLTVLLVDTHNTRYRLVVSQRTAVFVTGGRFFPDTTAARLEGASLGGSLLKLGWIGAGLCMEFQAGGQRIVTSPVRAIRRIEDAPAQ
jgi:hypothetical protein